jgi:hypothetical protein
MNFIIIFILTGLSQLVAPWWIVALVPFLVNVWRPSSRIRAFWVSFAAISLLWFSYGLYLHINSEGALSNRVAEIFSLPGGFVLLILTALMGGLVAGVAGLAGLFLNQVFEMKFVKTSVKRS